MNKFKIIPNPDESKYREVTEAVKMSNGYCPCLVWQNEDTKCICKEFRESNVAGRCRCGRYIKVVDTGDDNVR